MVMAQSLFITLKQKNPGCLIDVLAPEWSLPILKRMPEVNEGISADVRHGEFAFFKRRELGKKLKQKQYSHAIVIPRSWKSALIPYFAEIPVRTGYKGEMRFGLLNDIRVLNKTVLKQTVQRYVAHAYPDGLNEAPEIPLPALQPDAVNKARLLAHYGLKLDKPIVCMMPGAEFGPAKQWPVASYAKLALLLVEQGRKILVLGSEKDASAGDEITGGHSHEIMNLCGRTQLVDTVDLLSCAEAVVSNDSGLMHVAAAVGTKINVIYGSSTPEYTPPLTKDNLSDIYYRGISCSPCFKRSCQFGHYRCLTEITVEDVLRRLI